MFGISGINKKIYIYKQKFIQNMNRNSKIIYFK